MVNDWAVEVADLGVERGGARVLDAVSLRVPAGSVVGLLGPSGCGKTTLMRAVVGVQQRVTGTLRVLGRPAGDPELRRRVGYVTQGASVYPDLTVRQNLLYAAAVAGLDRRRAATAVERTLAEVDLQAQAGSLTARLSGGQRSRVGLGAALLPGPELLVLDEPTVGLDPVLRRELWQLFHRLAAAGTTLLVSSHVMDEADRCDDLVLLRAGRVVAQDSPAGLRERTGAADVETAFLALVGAL
ncbi:ABC transporter ATP-binding protein [Jannaschia sp. R86511]|uniref:ABC transporter ATP-binding protein n=1 Tax=Jannaschia sp. R86511 TaxID=3093853 RepID=UPI0036D20922